MGITERLERMLVRAEAPGHSVSAELRGRNEVSVWFAPGFYERADEHEMQNQLTQVAKLLWAARTREYQRIISDEHQQDLVGYRPVSQQDYDFCERRDNLVAEANSPSGRIRLTVRGMHEWKIWVAPGAMRELREDEFYAEICAAARELIDDQQAKIRQLKVSIYDPELADLYI